MPDDYHIIGGMVAFIIVILAIIGSASVEYPEVAGAATAPGGEWPPRFPVFGELTPDIGPAPGCDTVVLCMNVFAWWLVAGTLFILDIILFLAGVQLYLLQLFFGLFAFAVSGLPVEIAWLGIGIAIVFGIILILIFIRLILSAIPFVGG